MRSLAFAMLLASAGCDKLFDLVELPVPDAGSGGTGSDAAACFGTLVSICVHGQPEPLVSPGGMIDTDLDSQCQSRSDTDYCVIVGEQIRITRSLRVLGSRSLVLVATEAIEIASRLDASGLVTAPCAIGIDGEPGPSGAGGGAGGSFGFMGGPGAGVGASGPRGGTAAPAVAVTELRAGCPGGAGGASTTSTLAGGGAGGGAVYLIAGAAIRVAGGGEIDASGRGGAGGLVTYGGGGGGGSGGFIGLDAPMVDVAGDLYARGGGGGGGAGMATLGMKGDDPNRPTGSVRGGLPGAGGSAGGDGCGAPNGTVGGIPAQNPTAGGGGGGGGGCGVISIYGSSTFDSAPNPAPS